MLVGWGVINAINLDGGGSVTAVLNHTLVNYPGDIWYLLYISVVTKLPPGAIYIIVF